MAKINISEGQPFTYQVLNQIIEAVNNIKDPADPEKEIYVDGPVFLKNNKPKIIFGKQRVSITKNQTTFVESIKFPSQFSNDQPIVLASIVDTDPKSSRQLGYLTIIEIDKEKFKYTIKLLKTQAKGDVNFEVHYIALGMGPKQ